MTSYSRQPPVTPYRYSRFVAKFCEEAMTGCWLWRNGVNEHGYGVFWNGERLEKAHRFSLRASGVHVPDGAHVLHRCDTPACVNPDHLVVGCAQENTDDMWSKKRATVQRRRGTAQTQAKLTDDTAAEIRKLYATGLFKQRDLAADFGVSQTAVWRVVNRLGWAKPSGVEIETRRGR